MSGSGTLQNWGLPEQYHLSDGEMRLVEDRARRRSALKKEFHRIQFNPYRHMKTEGLIPFDPQFQRFASTRADYYHYFKPNKWNFAFLVCAWIAPMVGLIYVTGKMRWGFDAKCRNAEIPWRYRNKLF